MPHIQDPYGGWAKNSQQSLGKLWVAFWDMWHSAPWGNNECLPQFAPLQQLKEAFWMKCCGLHEGKVIFPTAGPTPIWPLPSDLSCLNYWRRIFKENILAVMTGCQVKPDFFSVRIEQVVCWCDMQWWWWWWRRWQWRWRWWTWSHTGISWGVEYLSSKVLYQGANFVGYADTRWERICDILLPVQCLPSSVLVRA